MRRLYSFLLYLLTPFFLGYMAVRGLGDRRWLARWPQRFGFFNAIGWMRGFVVHAASVGEVNAAAPLIRMLRRRWPNFPVTVTCITPTGSERIRSLFGCEVFHVYAPLDLPGSVRRFLDTLKPRMLIIMETEIWPNLFHHARRVGLPILISNARLTERSVRRWNRFGELAGETLRCASLIAAQTAADTHRFMSLGSDRDRTRTVGNLKFDIDLPNGVMERGHEWRARWGPERTVMVAGSTHEQDESALLEAATAMLEHDANTLLVLAPRYPERFDRAAELAASAGLAVCRLSECNAGETMQCLVVDRMGELLDFYAAADIAFVGGTMAPVGGHNPLEAAAVGRPVLIGPHTGHIESLATELLRAGAALRVDSPEALPEAWQSLHDDRKRREGMGQAARQVVESQRGALARTVQVIETLLVQ